VDGNLGAGVIIVLGAVLRVDLDSLTLWLLFNIDIVCGRRVLLWIYYFLYTALMYLLSHVVRYIC
jgi:hypothetical protein